MERYRIKPGCRPSLSRFDPDDTGAYKKNDAGKAKAKAAAAKFIAQLDQVQERLYANKTRALLIILQGMDTSGKDGTIKHVMSGVNPQGCRVASFKAPSEKELEQDFLWRIHQEVPPKGYIGIFNRSQYEDVLITRVHGLVSKKVVTQRFNQINEFEELLVENGTAIIKLFLHISKDEQKERLTERIRDPEKRWKFSEGDVEERKMWDDYMTAFEDVMAATSTERAPWYIVPADKKWIRDLYIGSVLVAALEGLDMRYPDPAPGLDKVVIK